MKIACALLLFLMCAGVQAQTHEAPATSAHEAAGAEAEESSEIREFPAKHSSRQMRIPSALVEKIEKDYRTFRELQHVPKEAPLQRAFLDGQVELTQNESAALKENARVLTPAGGGVVDLEAFVTPLKGSFRTRIIFEREDKEPLIDFRLYYISQAQQRKIEGESFGAGCGRYFDITHFFKTKMSRKGLEVFSAEQRYLTVLAGTYLMVSFTKEALLVGSITIEDSRYPSLQCGKSAG